MICEHVETRRVDDDPVVLHDRGSLRGSADLQLVLLERFASAILETCGRFDPCDDRREDVRVIVVRDTLQRGGDPLEPRARIDGWLWQRHERPVRLPIILHEDEVPDLEKATGFRALHEGVERELRALQIGPLALRIGGKAPVPGQVREIHINLRTRPAWARVRHLPEVVLVGQSVDPLVPEAGNLAPELSGFVVPMVDAHANQLRIDSQIPRDELPAEPDCIALEVISEREVPEHLEEGVVPGGVADLFEIVVFAARAHAFLRRRRASYAADGLLQPEEYLLELHHPRVGEQQRGIVRGDE